MARIRAGVRGAVGLSLCSWRGACVIALLWHAATDRVCAQSDYESVLEQALRAYAVTDYDAARTFMEQAHALEPSARTLRGLALIDFAQGRYAESALRLEASLVAPVRPLTPELRAAVEELLSRIWSLTGRVRLTIDPPTSMLHVDGAPPSWHGAGEIALEPGHHRLELSAAGHAPYEMDITVLPGSLQTLHIALAPQALPPLTSAARPAPVVAATAENQAFAPSWWSPAVRRSAYALGGGAAAAGLALWLTAWRKFDRVDAWCGEQTAGGCTNEQAEQRFDDAGVRTSVRAAAVVGSVGAAALVGSVWLDVRRRRQRARLQLAPARAALTVRF